MNASTYLLAGQVSEQERLRLQSRVLSAERSGSVRSVAFVLVAVLLVGYCVVVAADGLAVPSRAAVTAPPPPGGLVPSVTNFGWTEGEFSVSHDGAARYNVSLWTPRGRGAVTPALSLSYHSRGGNGPLGVGWTLNGLSSITWCPRTLANDGFAEGVNFDGSSGLCLGENRLLPLSRQPFPEREYRTERETFERIIAYGMEDNIPNYFKVWAKDGKIYTFGQTPDSRLETFRLVRGGGGVVRESSNRMISAWAVNRIEDRNDNAATVEYNRFEGDEASLWFVDMGPGTIRYAPNRTVQFVYEDRPDPVDGFARGVHTRTGSRLSKIVMSGGAQGAPIEMLREYQLSYQSNSITGRSLLSAITECDSGAACKIPLLFNWSRGGYDFEVIDTNITDAGTNRDSGNRVFVGDINGDGRDDLLYAVGPEEDWKIRLSTGRGFGPATSAGIPKVNIAARPTQLRVVDADRDGRMDVLAEIPDGSLGGTGWQLFRSNGTAFRPHQKIGSAGPQDNELDPVYFADLDGNGMPDFLTAPDEPEANPNLVNPIDGPWRYQLNTGSDTDDRFRPMVVSNVRDPNRPDRNNVADSDGDGRAELLGVAAEGFGTFSLGATGGFDTGQTNVPADKPNMGDFNGDGLADGIVTSRTPGPTEPPWTADVLYAKVNAGSNGAKESARLTNGAYFKPQTDNALRIVDFNNDGRDDVLVFRGGQPENRDDHGRGVQLYVWKDNGFVRAPLSKATGEPNPNNGFAANQPLDIDGDGVLDIVHVQDGRLRILKRTSGPPDELVSAGVFFPDGRRVEIDYTTLADRVTHTPGMCTYPLTCPATGHRIVREHRVATGEPEPVQWRTFRHTYQAARMDLHGRGWLGFAEHTILDVDTGGTTVTEFDNVTRVVDRTSEFAATEAYPFAQLPRHVTTTVAASPGGREHRRTVNTDLVVRRITAGSYTVEPRNVNELEQERPSGGAWSTIRLVSKNSTFDAFGNADLVVTNTVNGRKITEDPQFQNDPVTWLIGLPVRQASTGCTAAGVCLTRTSTSAYDPKGNLTETVVEPNKPAFKLTRTMEYGQFGIVKSTTRTDGGGEARREAFEYNDADKLYPTAAIDAMGHRTQLQTHSGLGVPLATIDPNGVLDTMRYDRFGRLRETNHSDGTFEHISHMNFLGFQITSTNLAGGGGNTSVLDSFGREVQRGVVGFDGVNTITTIGYDRFGRVHTVSTPHHNGDQVQNTISEYDNRGRLLCTTAPDGVKVRHEYINRETHTYDGKGIHSFNTTTVDGDIEASFEDDPDSANWLATTFEYGPFGERTKTVAADGTVETTVYDVLGRPKRHTDPSAGATERTYTAFGETATATDAANHTTEYRYDALGRVKSTTSPDGVATNTWDTAPNGIGKLANAKSPDGVGINYRYDSLSRPSTTTWNVEGTQYEIAAGYDEFGRQNSLTYPAVPGTNVRLTINHVYNPHGYLMQVKNAAANGTAYWTAENRNPAGQLVRERYGNGTVTDRIYDNRTGLMGDVITTGPGTTTSLARIHYDYDANRNVDHRFDVVNGRNEVYTYDELNRIKRWHTIASTPAVTDAFSYDKVGNLKTETFQRAGEPARTTTYDYGQNGAPPHAMTARNNQPYTYDGAGRQTSGAGRTITYNQSGLPKTLTWSQGQRTDFRYDPNGARVLKRDAGPGGASIVSVAGLVERRKPAGTGSTDIHNVHNIVVGGRTVAQIIYVQATENGPVTGIKPVYLHADLQGSTTLVTNAAGRKVDNEDGWLRDLFYDPFGRRVDANYEPLGNQRRGGPRLGYTGHEHDDELGLINMKGRVYDPETRRFLTPDPLLANPLSSQSHNRYAYVQNNPATLTDPTGLLITDSGSMAGRGGGGGGFGRGSFGPGYTALGYPSGGTVGWSGSPLDAPLITHAPDMSTTRSVGAGTDDDNAKASTSKQESDDSGMDLVGSAIDVLDQGKVFLNGPLGTLVTLVNTLLDSMGITEGPPDLSGGYWKTVWNVFQTAGALSQAWVALRTMTYWAFGGLSFAAAAEAAASAGAIAAFASFSELIGIAVGCYMILTWAGIDETNWGEALIRANAAETDGWILIGNALIDAGGAVIDGAVSVGKSIGNGAANVATGVATGATNVVSATVDSTREIVNNAAAGVDLIGHELFRPYLPDSRLNPMPLAGHPDGSNEFDRAKRRKW